ncbi:hypothetical protein FOZ61_009762 [Perkinsus olseni]|uniref:Uncharacterized protein n=1 Tax=Perkinsus olseni TaxID=32597 RepID=A0A7J6KZH6_PEROL|nr:hypothetical protein FOZ61_009762 [Perkinsus olseni]KAF4653338.1 hypothetical protein FOL46_009240 [Perkinsus olseni]
MPPPPPPSPSSSEPREDDAERNTESRRSPFPSNLGKGLGPKTILRRNRPEEPAAGPSSQITRIKHRSQREAASEVSEERSIPSQSASIVEGDESSSAAAAAIPPSAPPPSMETPSQQQQPPTLHQAARASDVFHIAEVTYPGGPARHGKGSGSINRRGDSPSVEFKFTSPIDKVLTKNRNYLVVTALSLHSGAGKSTVLNHLSGPTNTRMPTYEYPHGRPRSATGKRTGRGVDAWLTLDRIIVLDPVGISLLSSQRDTAASNGTGRERRGGHHSDHDTAQNAIVRWLLSVVDVVIAVVCSSKELAKLEEIISANSPCEDGGRAPQILPVLNFAIPQTHDSASFDGPCVPFIITPEDEKSEAAYDNGRRLISYPGLNDVLHTTPLSLDVSFMLRDAVRAKAISGATRHSTEIEWWTTSSVKWRESLAARQSTEVEDVRSTTIKRDDDANLAKA